MNIISLYFFVSIFNLSTYQKEIEIPFTFYENKIIIVVAVEGVQKSFIIDTSAPSFIKKGKMNDSTKIYHHLKFRGLEIDSFKFLVNTYDFDSDKFEHIYGILGYDFLSQYNLFVDWDAEMLVLRKRGSLNIDKAASHAKYTLPFQFQNNSPPKLTLHINNFIVQPGISFDTGSGGGILLENSFYKYYSKRVDSSRLNKIEFSYTDVNGKHSGFHNTIEFDSLKIGDLKLENETVIFNETHNIIGLKYFLDYNIEINWNSNTIFLFERVE